MGFYDVNSALANFWPGWANEAAQLRQRADQERAQPIPDSIPEYAERVEFAARKFDEQATLPDMRAKFAKLNPPMLYLGPEDLNFRMDPKNAELIAECQSQNRVFYGWPEDPGHDIKALARLQQGNVKP